MILNKIKCINNRVFLTVLLLVTSVNIGAQQVPLNPVSYRIFSPYIFNPAITGSKDFTTIDFLYGTSGKSSSQIIGGNMRFSKPGPEYFSAITNPLFTKIGFGGYFYNDENELSQNLGFGVSGSYHFQINKNASSFLSVGLSAKMNSHRNSGDTDGGNTGINSKTPNFDAGLYFYSAKFFSGLSVTNLLGNPDPDSLGSYVNPVSRQFFFNAGYKIILSRALDILAEPSLIINSDDNFSNDILKMVKPAMKIYAGSFCIGTYFNEFEKIPFFLQYKYSKVTLGTFFEIPYQSAFYKNPLLAEFFIGINLSAIKSGFSRGYHW